MRFIVDLYRYILVALCGITIIALAFAFFAFIDASGPTGGAYPEWVIAATIVVAIVFVLSIGGLAIIISLHDRHAELTDAAHDIRDALNRIADARPSRESDR
ncbi:hypothetical protein [Sphingomonas sp.]|uniref:hypothetical protein n=1 Tax=Sphingomonas sp. TaxID=28214 RepID=UPI0035C855CB